jgi:hypothetical protein
MKFITVLAAALVAKASATAVCPSNSTDLANMNPLLRMKVCAPLLHADVTGPAGNQQPPRSEWLTVCTCLQASVVSFDTRAEVFLSGLSTEPVENNGTVGAKICPGVGLNCCGEKNFQRMCAIACGTCAILLLRCDAAPFSTLPIDHAVIADMYQSIANETNNEISEFSSSVDQLQGPLQTAADGIRTTADMLSKSVILYVACARLALDDGMAVITLFLWGLKLLVILEICF